MTSPSPMSQCAVYEDDEFQRWLAEDYKPIAGSWQY
jgi:hypothetical protein